MDRAIKPLIKILTTLVNVMYFLEKRLTIKPIRNAQNENVRIKKNGSIIIWKGPILPSNIPQTIYEIDNNINSYFIAFKNFIKSFII